MGEKGVVVGVGDDMMEGMQCSEHPYRSNPGGICALCLQERLGKLVSSSKSNNPFFTLPTDHKTTAASPSASPPSTLGSTSRAAATGRGTTKIPFLSSSIINHKKNRNVAAAASTAAASSSSSSSILKRSKSVAPKPIGEIGSVTATTNSPRMKKSLWSFFYLSSYSTTTYASKRRSAASTVRSGGATACNGQQHPPSVESRSSSGAREAAEESTATEAVASPSGSVSSSSFGRKVARSRSVGCGSRSFSGDFLERISTGFGDCSTLRRVESQRESKPKPKISFSNGGDGGVEEQQRVKYCGGLFGGFGMMSSSSSSSSYWLSTATTDHHHHRMSTSAAGGGGGRSRSWVWGSFASPMRAFRPTSYSSAVTSKPYAITAANTTTTTGNAKLGGSSLNPSSLPVGC